MNTAVKFAVLFVFVILFSGCCRSIGMSDTCGVSKNTAFFAADEAIQRRFKSLQSDFEEVGIDEQDIPRECCNGFNDIVRPVCQDKSLKFCDENCKNEEISLCKNDQRTPVLQSCLKTILPTFHQIVPICSEMIVEGIFTYWPDSAGKPQLCPPSNK